MGTYHRPLNVDCDLQGRSLQSEMQERVKLVFTEVLKQFSRPTLKIFGEIPDSTEEVV